MSDGEIVEFVHARIRALTANVTAPSSQAAS